MHRALISCLFLLALPLSAQSANADATANLLHQTLFLRGSWRGDRLKFDATGRLIGTSPVGSFTTSGFEVEKVTLRPDGLAMEGNRVGIRFDGDLPERVTLPEHYGSSKAEKVRVEIQAATDSDRKKALEAIFAMRLEDLVPALPDYWQTFAQEHLLHPELVNEELPEDEETPGAEPVRTISEAKKVVRTPAGVSRIGGSIKPPVPIKMPDPKFSQEARQTRVSGKVLVYLWVDQSGRPTHVHLVRPCGMGLDEAAVDAVSHYVFRPATRDGVPVTVEMNVEVTFQVY